MKKLVVLLLSALMVFGLVGCKTNTGGGSIKVGVSIYTFADKWMTVYRTELENYVKGLGYEIQIDDGQDNQDTQTSQVENFIAQKFDVIIVNMVNPEAASVIVDKCKAADIPVVFINTEPAEADQALWPGKQTYIGANAADSGTMQGELVVDLPDSGDLNGNGTLDYIMLIGNPANIDAPLRTEYSIKAVEAAGVKVNKLDEKICMWMNDQAEVAVSDFLVKHGKGKIDIIFANNDDMALGALTAVKNAGWVPGVDIYIVGVDATDDARAAVDAGEMAGTVLNDAVGQSHKAADVAIELAKGGSVDSKYYVPYQPVRKD